MEIREKELDDTVFAITLDGPTGQVKCSICGKEFEAGWPGLVDTRGGFIDGSAGLDGCNAVCLECGQKEVPCLVACLKGRQTFFVSSTVTPVS